MATNATKARANQCPIVIRIDEDLRAALKAKADEDERTVASAIRFALRAYVNR